MPLTTLLLDSLPWTKGTRVYWVRHSERISGSPGSLLAAIRHRRQLSGISVLLFIRPDCTSSPDAQIAQIRTVCGCWQSIFHLLGGGAKDLLEDDVIQRQQALTWWKHTPKPSPSLHLLDNLLQLGQLLLEGSNHPGIIWYRHIKLL